jgi:hypothetical protein
MFHFAAIRPGIPKQQPELTTAKGAQPQEFLVALKP